LIVAINQSQGPPTLQVGGAGWPMALICWGRLVVMSC